MRALLVAIAVLALAGCVRETVSCTVLQPDDPLCQDPDTGVLDAGVDAAEPSDAEPSDAELIDAE